MMKSTALNFCLLVFIICSCFSLVAQRTETRTHSSTQYPASFTIDKADLDALLLKKAKETVSSKKNIYIDQSTVVLNVLNGDTRFERIRLHYFSGAYLSIQVNGIYSTQVFVLSDDKSVSYKGKLVNGDVILTRCAEDEIVSE